MYDEDATRCQQYSFMSARNIERMVLMVSQSIQQSWSEVGMMLNDVEEKGLESIYLNWQMKQDTYKYLKSNRDFMFGQLLAIKNSYKCDNAKAYSAMKVFLKVKGLNLVKAGFCVQLSFGLVGCFDSHNLARYNIKNRNHLRINKDVTTFKGKARNEAKLINYIDLCHSIGTKNMWNDWCYNLAQQERNKFKSGEEVSKAHYNYLIGEVI